METKKIAELAKILRQNQLTKLELTEGDNRLVLEAANGRIIPAEAPSPVFAEEAAEPSELTPETPEFHRRRTEIPAGGYGLPCSTERRGTFRKSRQQGQGRRCAVHCGIHENVQ